jgi:hypothetical protein
MNRGVAFRVGLVALMMLGAAHRDVTSADGAGSLLVVSDPSGASVYIDGRLVGETPVTVTGITVGVRRVRLVRLGYLENSRLVTIKAGSRATLRAQLTTPIPQDARQPALKIVVIDGEGAINIIQQKTATAPVVEVRDQNDLPVGGVTVTFSIDGSGASFGGSSALTVVTNAAGRAVATGLTPTASGSLQISVSAVFQGQTAFATIAQKNVLTAAQAAGASAPAPAAGSGGAAGGGGGRSKTRLLIVGAAAAGGIVIANQLQSDRSRSFGGDFAGPLTTTFRDNPPQTGGCVRTDMYTGTLRMDLAIAGDGGVKGTANIDAVGIVTAVTCSNGPQLNASIPVRIRGLDVTGTTAALAMNQVLSETAQGFSITDTWTFTGALNANVITGTLSLASTITSAGNTGSGSVSYTVTLR